jgi:hypothetical protein
MRIDRMKEGQLYQIKSNTCLEGWMHRVGPQNEYKVLMGYNTRDNNRWDHPPMVYLGFKMEEWEYDFRSTNKIHYVMWQEEIWVMDNGFAKHIIPVWDGDSDGQEE